MSQRLVLKTIVHLFRTAGVCYCYIVVVFLSSAASLFFVFRFHNNSISTQWPIVYLISPTVFLFVFSCFTIFFVAIVNDECWLFVIRLSPPPGLGRRVSSGDTEGLTWQNLISGAVVSALNHPISSSNSLACDGQALCLGWGGEGVGYVCVCVRVCKCPGYSTKKDSRWVYDIYIFTSWMI